MRRSIGWLLLAWVAAHALAAYPERLLDWEEFAGPTSEHKVSTLAAGDALYAGARDAGVHRFDAATQTWAPHGLSGLRVQDLCADGDTLYAVVGDYSEPELYRVVSDGDWTKLPALSGRIESLAVFRSNVDALVHDGLARVDLTTGALTPISIPVPSPDIHRIELMGYVNDRHIGLATQAGHVFSFPPGEPAVGMWRHGPPGFVHHDVVADSSGATVLTDDGIFHQPEDNSEEWHETARAEEMPLATMIVEARGGRSWVASPHVGVHVRTRNSWRAKNDGLTNLDTRALAVSPDQGGSSLYVAIYRDGVHVLRPKTALWTPMSRGLTNPRTLSLATHGEAVYAGATEGTVSCWDWDDAQPKWRSLPTPVPGGDVRALAVTANAIYAATPEGPFVSTHAGDGWERIETFVRARGGIVSSARRLYVTTSSGGVFGAGDAEAWDPLLPESKYGLPSAIAVDGDALYMAGYYGVFRLSKPGGEWTRLSPSGKTTDGVIRVGAKERSTTFMIQWAFGDIAIHDGVVYGSTQTRLVRARLP
jgi:hypothetical protein